MKTSEKGIALIKASEAFKAKPYLCPAGVPTIGYGATYYPDGHKVTLQDPAISEAVASSLLANMLIAYEKAVDKMVHVQLKQGQFDALVSFAYNCGIAALQGSTLLRKLNAGDYTGACNEFPKWDKAGGNVLAGLTKRRAAERLLFLGGV